MATDAPEMSGRRIRPGRLRETLFVQVFNEVVDLYAPHIGGAAGLGYWTYLRRFVNHDPANGWYGQAFPTKARIKSDLCLGTAKVKDLERDCVAWGLLDIEVVRQRRFCGGQVVGETRRFVYRINDPLSAEEFRQAVESGALPRRETAPTLPHALPDDSGRGTCLDRHVPHPNEGGTCPGRHVGTCLPGHAQKEKQAWEKEQHPERPERGRHVAASPDPEGARATPVGSAPRQDPGPRGTPAPEPAPAVPARGVALLASPGGDRESPTQAAPDGLPAGPEPVIPQQGGRHVAAAPEPAPAVPARGVALLASPSGDRESPTQAAPDGLPAGPEPVIPDAAVPNVADSDQVPAVPEPAQPQDPMDAAAICAAYSARTGLDDLLPEALDTLSRRRALTEAYVTAKLSLLGDALVAGTVHNPRGFLLRALEGDWTPATAPASQRRSLRPHRAIPARSTASVPTPRGTAPGSGLPAAAIPPVVARDAGAPAQLAAALVQLGVVPPTAERLVRAQPDEVGRQLSWIAYRHAQDPAALIVRAIGERWPEPAVVRQERMADAEREQTRAQLAAIEEARTLALSPSGREAARRGFAQIREMLSPSATSPPTVGRTAP